MHKWFTYLPAAPHSLPEVPGCYALVLDGKVVYVGQSINLQARFKQHGIRAVSGGAHETKWGRLVGELQLKVRFAQKHGDWYMREARLISRLKPVFNKRGG